MIKFPVRVQDIMDFVPHRPPMVWIDAVTEVDTTGGICLVEVKEAPYLNNGRIRPSSFIEFIGQSYGYVSACQNKVFPDHQRKKPEVAYLCGIKDFEISDVKIGIGEKLRVVVKKTHELGPITLVEGKVFTEAGQVIASGQIKLYAQ